jgi:hypothetical protein
MCELNILAAEVCVCDRRVLLFFTHDGDDKELAETVFRGAKFAPVPGVDDKQELARIQHDDLPEKTSRTCHPRYLQTRRQSVLQVLLRCIES